MILTIEASSAAELRAKIEELTEVFGISGDIQNPVESEFESKPTVDSKSKFRKSKRTGGRPKKTRTEAPPTVTLHPGADPEIEEEIIVTQPNPVTGTSGSKELSDSTEKTSPGELPSPTEPTSAESISEGSGSLMSPLRDEGSTKEVTSNDPKKVTHNETTQKETTQKETTQKETTQKETSSKDALDAFQKFVEKRGLQKARDLLLQFGAQRFSDVPADKYPEFISGCNQ